MPLDIGIIGAGIAGLSAAIALSRASSSNTITIYEKSQFRNETGAAIMIGPNGTRILRTWGFGFDEASALDYNQMRRIKADTIELDSEEHFEGIEDRYGSRWLLFHRADLHAGLRDLVEEAKNVKVCLGTAVSDVDLEEGLIVLANGEEVKKDLIVIADGAHSDLLSKVIGRPYPVNKSPMSMYRFLQPMDRVLSHPEAGKFYQSQPPGLTTFYKTEVGRPGLLLNTYPCRGGELLYVALLHPTKPQEKGTEGWSTPADAENVISDAKGFHPAVQAICAGATDVKVYQNMWRDPVETYTKGKAVVIGDAAHLCLPTHGQGSAMALEDCMALEGLLGGVEKSDEVQPQLRMFDKLRLPRVSAVQTMSNKMMGPPDKMISEVKRYYDGEIPGPKSKTFSKEYNDFFFLYDIAEEARTLKMT